MRAIRIDVETRTITEVQIKKGIQAIYKELDCQTFECPVSYDNEDTMYCDEEALLNKDSIKGGFMFPDYEYPIVGTALIIGTDDEGVSVDAKSSLEDFQDIRWISKAVCLNWAEDVVG